MDNSARTDTNIEEQWTMTSTELNAVRDVAEDSQRFARKEDAEDAEN